MARFKIFPVISNKVKKATSSAMKQAGQNSKDWFKSTVTDTFGKKRTRTAGAFSRKEIKAQQDAADVEVSKQNKTKQSAARPRNYTLTPEQQIAGGKKNKVSSNDPTQVTPRASAAVNKNLRKNTTMDSTFKKNLRNTNVPLVGHMYFYIYDPKHKKTLPYYDVFPLVIPMEYYTDGFLGMNLHYVAPIGRASLLDYLISLERSMVVNGNVEKYMNVSYGMLKQTASSKFFKPTIKRYLYSHVKSPFAEVLSDEWENAAFLPVEQFRKSTKREVWADNRTKR